MAAELGIDPADLDRRAAAAYGLMVDGLVASGRSSHDGQASGRAST